MADLLAATVTYGGYINLFKFLIILAAFFGWLPLTNWVYEDSQAVRTNKNLWTLTFSLTGAVSLMMWLIIPAYIIGLLIFLISIGGIFMAYVIHRNALVADFEKVFTADHIRNLFVNAEKKLQKASRGLSFITANGNEVPLPQPKTTEAYGFVTTCDIMEDAIWRRASQVFFNPQKEDYEVLYIIDGIQSKQPSRSREEMDYLIYYLKELAALDVEEKRKPQQGRFRVIVNKDVLNPIGWEVNTAGSTAGEQLKLVRMADKSPKKIEDLGFNENQIASIETLRNETKGLVLISGPAGSGRTTTLYTLLRGHDPFLYNINTLEKNPSCDLQNITQHIFTLSDTGTTSYSRKLQTLLRRGPDIVGIEDCDDPQCAQLASAAVKEGKMIYAVLDANSVSHALEKWIKLVGDKELVADTLTAIINQQLVRVLCDQCRVAYKPNPALFKKFNIPANDVDMFYRPGEIEQDKHGRPIICEKCQGTGYFGRMGLFETIRFSPDLSRAIKQAKTSHEIISALRKAGMLYMQEQSIKKVSLGMTSINEVIRNFSTKNP
jgi:type II secretory ATPase GspE/PulE/Tfp pilus assembly ATPase PilB-like protein